MEDICEFLSSLVHVHGKTTLKEFLKRALLKENKELNTFLEDEIHNLYHTYEKDDCCGCSGPRRRKGKTYLREKQWARMYEIQKERCEHCKKQKKRKTICQYGVIADVAISTFDITLLTTLLLHFQKRFNILDKDINHILPISEHRDWLAHDEHSTSTVPEVWGRCNDITMSINELARACSAEFAKERDVKIKLEKETYWNLFELQEKFPPHSVSFVKKEAFVDESHYLEYYRSLIYRHGKDTLSEFFNKKLHDNQTGIQHLLKSEFHVLYHTYESGNCCQCTTRTVKRTQIKEEQWANLCETQTKSQFCRKRKKCICQYYIKPNINMSSFDISILATLLLVLVSPLSIAEHEIRCIKCIRKHRNSEAHEKQSIRALKGKCSDLTVSINDLARECSLQFAMERSEKMKQEDDAHKNLDEMQKEFSSKTISISRKQENGNEIVVQTNNSERLDDIQKLEGHFRNKGCDITTYNIDEIKARLSIAEYKRRVLLDIDPASVIDFLHRGGHFTDFEMQSLMEFNGEADSSKELLRTILSKDDAVIVVFMQSLLSTEQRSIHNYILGNDDRSKFRLILNSDIPLEHPSSFNMTLEMELKNRPDLMNMVFNHLDNGEKIGDMKVYDKETGSIIIHLRPETTEDCDKFTRAYYNGTLRAQIEDFLRRAGVLKELVKDEIKIVVNISMAGSDDTKKNKSIYDKFWDYLIEKMSPKPVVDMLLQKGILDRNDAKDIYRTQTRFSQSNTLLCKLKIIGSETIPVFKQCLAATSQEYILRKFQEAEEIPPVEMTENFWDAISNATDTKEMLITDESVNEQKLRILLFDGGRRALRYTVLRIVLDANLKNNDEQTRLQFCENDRNLLFPTDFPLPSLKGLTDAGLLTVWTKVLQQKPETQRATQDIIYDYLVNQGLTTQLENNKPRIQTMMEQKLLSQDQWKILFPQSNATFRFENIDFELLCFLIHHVFQLQPSSGYQLIGPVPSVVCIGDDLSRLKYHRDILAQKSSSGIDNKEFNTAWTEIRDIFLRLVGQCFSDEIQYLYDCPADPAKAVEFKNLRGEMKKLSANVQDQDEQHKLEQGKDSSLDKALSTKMSKEPENIFSKEGKDSSLDKALSTEMSKEPENIIFSKEGATQTLEDRPRCMLSAVEAWRKEDIYVTKCVKAVKEKISSKGCVCVIGVPGAGKSTALHHAALHLESEGFTVYIISGPEELLKKYYDINKKQVFVLDDALGVYSVDQGMVKSWQKDNENVRIVLGTNTKLLVSIRTQIYMYETIRDKNIVFLDKSVTTDHVNYSDADYKLELDDMIGMLTHYMRNKGTDSDSIDKVIQQVWGYTEKQWTEMTEEDRQVEMPLYTAGVEFADCFPLLCAVFVNTVFAKQNPEEFFKNPFRALTRVFQNIKTDNKHQFCALVLSTMFDGKLTDDLVSPLSESPLCDDKNKRDKDKEIRNHIMSTYKLKCPDDLEDLQSALNSLTGVYILHVGDTYKISHTVFHDIVTYLYNDPLFVMKYGTREFIRDRVRLNRGEQQHDPYVLVYSDDTNIERLADRLYRDFKSDIETKAEITSGRSDTWPVAVITSGCSDTWTVAEITLRCSDTWTAAEITSRCSDTWTVAEIISWYSDTWTGAEYITENPNIHDDRLISCLRSKLTDRDQIDKKMIDDLFAQCMWTMYYNRDTYKHGDVPSYKLIQLCLQREADCSNMYIDDAWYPLHVSVMTDSLQLTQLLLQHGADKRRVDCVGDSVLHRVCKYTNYNRLDLIKLLTQDGDLSVVEFITSDKQTILQILDDSDDSEILEAFDSDILQLEEVLSDNSIEVLTTDKHQMKDYVEHSEGKIQLVRCVHDNILTYVDVLGRNILHYLAGDSKSTSYVLGLMSDTRQAVNQQDEEGRKPYWYVLNKQCPDDMGREKEKLTDKDREDMIQLYKDNHAILSDSSDDSSKEDILSDSSDDSS